MRKKNRVAIFIACFGLFLQLTSQKQNVNPLSKIVITSQKAICQRDSNNPQFFIFNYIDDVKVVFADNSVITASSLEVLFDGKSVEKKINNDNSPTATIRAKGTTPTTGSKLSQFKNIIFKNNVHLTNQNRSAFAQKAEINLVENTCKFEGSVHIDQQKTSPKDLPISIESQEAVLNLKTDELTFQGSCATPVSTVISFSDYEPLQKKSGKHHKKRRTHEQN